ncbi:MAG: aminotransferase class I/II-fold pyridoxal phosphate-dependent enzyme [Lactobacillaceae bacterium]|jgi:cystathionine beta-lyase|nr:aminotransferase class I/II-fold pyridoxal phosphate-dependent enzyme [Lactobacillaceae bacterium]
MKTDFDLIINRRNTNSCKWDSQALRYHRNDLLHFGVADMDFKSPEPIQRSLMGIVNHDIYGYTDLNEKFYQSIQNHYHQKYNIEIPLEWIVFSPRIINSAAAFVNVMTQDNDGVLINEPCYSPLKNAIITNHRNPISIPLQFINNQWTMDFDLIETQALQSNNNTMFFVNPDNPTGTVWNQESTQRLMKIAKNHNLTIFTDEIHADILKSGVKHHSLLENLSLNDKIVVANSSTKSFNIPGLEISYLIIPNHEIREKIQLELNRMGFYNPNIFAGPALITGYTNDECKQWLAELNLYVDANETYVCDFLHEHCPQFIVYPHQGTYTLWINYEQTNKTAEEIQEWFIEKVGAEVYMGSTFGPYGDGFIRLNIATSKLNLQQLLTAMDENYHLISDD